MPNGRQTQAKSIRRICNDLEQKLMKEEVNFLFH